MMRPALLKRTPQVSATASVPGMQPPPPPQSIKCTNCCTLLLTEFRKDGKIPLGVTMGAVPRFDGQRSFIPMSSILNSILKLPMVNAWTPRATFCPSCARLIMQMYIANLELAKVSKVESHLNRVHKQIEALLQCYNLTSTPPVSVSNARRQGRKVNLPGVVRTVQQATEKIPVILRTRSLASASDSDFMDDSMDFDSSEMDTNYDDVPHSKRPVVTSSMKNKPVQKSDNILRTPKQASSTNIVTRTSLAIPEKKSQSSSQMNRGDIPANVVAPNPNSIKIKPDPDDALNSPATKQQPQLPHPDGVKQILIGGNQKEAAAAVHPELSDAVEAVDEGPPLPVLKSANVRRVTRFYLRRYTGKCSKCDERFRRLSLEEVETHFDIKHQGMLELICNICEQPLFLRSATFRRHYKSHVDSDESKISMHLRSTCGLDLKARVCPNNSAGSRQPISETEKLERRKAIDLALKHRQKFLISRTPAIKHPPCPHCGKVLKSKDKGALKEHIKLHQRVKVRRERVNKIFCDICEKPCYNRFHKKRHERTHLNQTERMNLEAEEGIPSAAFLCSECGKTLSSQTSLLHHSRIHEDPSKRKFHHCEEPGCSFKSLGKTTLTTHQRQFHDPNSEPKFKCKQCNQGFRDHRLHKEHQMTECDAWNRPFLCDQSPCQNRFKAKQGLVLHLLGVHKMNPVEAREKVYPDLDCPEWVGKKYKKYTSSKNIKF